MNDINIRFIPHHTHRYPSCGDYFEQPNGDWMIEVSETADWRSAFVVALHEAVEAALCKARGVEWAVIDDFDIEYEHARPEGDDSEPGDAPNSPYRTAHRFAENIERLVAAELGLDWQAHERAIGELQ